MAIIIIIVIIMIMSLIMIMLGLVNCHNITMGKAEQVYHRGRGIGRGRAFRGRVK